MDTRKAVLFRNTKAPLVSSLMDTAFFHERSSSEATTVAAAPRKRLEEAPPAGSAAAEHPLNHPLRAGTAAMIVVWKSRRAATMESIYYIVS